MDLYPCPTDVIATFHSLSDSGIAIGRYPNIVLIILCCTFFFNRKMACSSSVPAFVANASNSIMKSAMFLFPCLNVSIFHLASVAFILLLNVVLISFMKSSQSWVSNSLSCSLSFCYTYIPATPSLRQARIAMILSLLRNNLIPLYQSSNFVQSLSNHPGSGTIFFDNPACLYSWLVTAIGAGAVDISVSICSLFVEASSVILRDPSHSDNASILFVLLELVVVLLNR